MNVRTNLLLPAELVAAVDEIAGPRGRSRYVAAALEKEIRRDRLRSAIDATAGLWRDHPLFPTADAVDAFIREGREHGRDPWSDPGR